MIQEMPKNASNLTDKQSLYIVGRIHYKPNGDYMHIKEWALQIRADIEIVFPWESPEYGYECHLRHSALQEGPGQNTFIAGFGTTPQEALIDYVERIRGRKLVIGWSHNPKIVQVPEDLVT